MSLPPQDDKTGSCTGPQMFELPDQVIRMIDIAIEEDLGSGDLTSDAVLSDDLTGKAVIEARETLVCCGLEIAREVFRRIDPEIAFTPLAGEGEEVAGGQVLAGLGGSVKSLLAGERTAVNFLQRTCGVATMSKHYTRLAAGRTVVLDSRKTVPGWRWLDKMAVRAGGCSNHRMGLFDGVLIKDNHIAASGGVGKAVSKAREKAPPGIDIEVEVEDMNELEEALVSGADIILLDNFTPEEVSQAVQICDGRAKLEVSGGINEKNIEAYLEAAEVDFISVGALTHSVTAVDIAMEIVGE